MGDDNKHQKALETQAVIITEKKKKEKNRSLMVGVFGEPWVNHSSAALPLVCEKQTHGSWAC